VEKFDPGKADLDIAADALRSVGIDALAHEDTDRISGGQRQLALIARALAQQSRMVIMDEPTASLDFGNRLLVLDRMRAMAGDGLAVLFSTHEPEHAFAVADSVVALGPGGYFVTGSPDVVLNAGSLTRLYGALLCVETTPTGRRVVSPAKQL
jgi:iron complex transport system ATP-binding protein